MSGRDVNEAVIVDSDHDIAIEVSDGQCSVTYVVHCIPPDFPEVSVVKKHAGVSEPRAFSFISEIELFDESFELIKTVEPLPPVMQATSHDFLITDEGNFMFMAYSPARRDFGEHGVHDLGNLSRLPRT